jgi:hypothetical protein
MSFTGTESHNITLAEASDLTANYRNMHPGQPLGFYFSESAISSILNQPDCIGIRIYYAQQLDGTPKMVISGVKANEDDLFNGTLAEFGLKSPPFSGVANPLNS